jgi:hypothetical protein
VNVSQDIFSTGQAERYSALSEGCFCRRLLLPHALTLKHVGAINKEQYNKLLIKCAIVCSLYIRCSGYFSTVNLGGYVRPAENNEEVNFQC